MSANPSRTAPPKTLQQAFLLFSTPQACHDFMVSVRWKGEPVACPRCGCVEVGFVRTRRIWNCRGCRKQFSVKVGTIFEDSPLPLSTWLPAVWLVTNAKNGISSCELARALGVTQKTAWFMLHRIRHIMETGGFEKMKGTVEADETFIGGLEKNKHADKKLRAGRGTVGKTPVAGLLERGTEETSSRVHARIVKTPNRQTLHGSIAERVDPGSHLYTDALPAYRGLEEYDHGFVDHAVRYVDGDVHTNGLENFWCLLKRGLKGTYVAVRPFHLDRYVIEEEFRFNNRHNDDGGRFLKTLAGAEGRRLTYEELTGSYLAYYDLFLPRETSSELPS